MCHKFSNRDGSTNHRPSNLTNSEIRKFHNINTVCVDTQIVLIGGAIAMAAAIEMLPLIGGISIAESFRSEIPLLTKESVGSAAV